MRGNLEFAPRGQPELPAALTTRMAQFRLLYAEILDLVAEMSQRQTGVRAGYPSLARYLSDLLRITHRKASAMITQAEQVAESMTPTGHVAPASLPRVRQALHDGTLDTEHVQAIADAVRELPDWAAPEHRDLVESTLTDTARVHDARVVREQGGSCWPASTRMATTRTRKTGWPNPRTPSITAWSGPEWWPSTAKSTPKRAKN